MQTLAFSIAVKAPSSSYSSWNHRLPVRKAFPIVSQSTIIIPGDDVSSIIGHWAPSHSNALYKIDAWGAPYFSVNSSGNIIIRPHGARTKDHEEIDLLEVVNKASDSKCVGGLDLQLPLIIKSPDILKDRLEYLQSSFNFAIKSQGYNSHYQGVYPVKCNQDRFLVEDIVKFGSSFGFGLEAGSKPELLLSMCCLCNGSPESLLICNGFKDAEYISLALIARKLSLNTVIVLEQEEELDSVLDISIKLDVRPILGVRAKLRTKHSGHFGSTSGTKGKFGLTTTQILRVVKRLEQCGMLDCFQLLHFHMGSQIPSTALLESGVCEAMQIYCELVRLGASMKVIDIGGGLGIDYDGSQSTNSDVSVGYTVEQYAMAVVHTVKFVCDRNFVKHPVICSESGRALVSHHSILIFEATCSSKYATPTMSSFDNQSFIEQLPEEAHLDYNNLSKSVVGGDYEACLVYTNQLKDKCVEMFKDGSLDMEQLAATDGLCDLVAKETGVSNHINTYHVNLSVFTSIPDFWAIQQLFPILPIHRLDECPTKRAILSDLTCDSDGKIDKFIGGEASLPLHELQGENGMKYYLGMFLGGAYQEALGGVHNLFGGPSVIHVSNSDGPFGFAITRAMPGSSCSDVLCSMQHEPDIMFQTLKHRIEEHVHDNGHMSVAMIANVIAKSFKNMPYLTGGCK